jgi:hypothetical protein
MLKRLGGWLAALALSLTPYAQAAVEAPSEQASPAVVVLFLVGFIGVCVAYFAYIWLRRKKDTTPPDA